MINIVSDGTKSVKHFMIARCPVTPLNLLDVAAISKVKSNLMTNEYYRDGENSYAIASLAHKWFPRFAQFTLLQSTDCRCLQILAK